MIVQPAAAIIASILFASPLLAQTTAPAAPVPSFASLFRDLGTDFRQLTSRENALMIAAAGGISLAVQHHDGAVTRYASRSPSLDTVFEAGDVVGGGVAQVGAALATFALGRAAGSPRVATVGADLVRAQMLNAVVTHGLKFSVGRTRPDGRPFSFPSGHTSSSFATAAVLGRHFGWKAGVPAYGMAAYIAGSRLQENKHYLSDVVFGAAIGIVSGRAVTVGRGRGTFAVAPFAALGGGGVGFSWIGAQ